MGNTQKNALALLVAGAMTLGLSFVIKRYTYFPDFNDGLFKGISIGLLLLSVILLSKKRKTQTQL